MITIQWTHFFIDSPRPPLPPACDVSKEEHLFALQYGPTYDLLLSTPLHLFLMYSDAEERLSSMASGQLTWAERVSCLLIIKLLMHSQTLTIQ